MIKKSFLNIFSLYSYLSDESITSNLLNKIENKEFEDIKSITDLEKFLFNLNKKIDIEDVLNRLFLLEANLYIVDGYLKENESDCYELRELNTQSSHILKEVLLMLESKNLSSDDNNNL